MKKGKQQSEMTIDTLALMVKHGFDDVGNELGNKIDTLDQNLREEMKMTEQNLREEFITSSDGIVGELQKMRQEHASSFGLYKELEQKVFTLEEKVGNLEKLKKDVRQLQLKFSHG